MLLLENRWVHVQLYECRELTDAIWQPLDKRRSRPQSPFVFDVSMDDEYDDEGECEPQAQSAAEVIASCAEDVAALWSDAGVQAVLSRRKAKARLEEGPGLCVLLITAITSR